MSKPLLYVEFIELEKKPFQPDTVKSTFRRGPFQEVKVDDSYVTAIYTDGSQEVIASSGYDGYWYLINNRGRDHVPYSHARIKVWHEDTAQENNDA